MNKQRRKAIEAIIERLDSCRAELEEKSPSGEVQRLADDVKGFQKEYATKEELKEIRSQIGEIKGSIDFLKEETVRKQEFIRVTTEISGKIDDLSKYLRGKL